MAKRGRPQKVTDEELINGVDEYLQSVKIPIVAEYALNNGISKQTLYKRASENEELSDSIKRIVDTKEVVLERGALTGELQQTMAIFSLKQIGWRDKPDDESVDATIKVVMDSSSELAD